MVTIYNHHARQISLLALAASFSFVTFGHAATLVWKGDVNTNWGTSGNWTDTAGNPVVGTAANPAVISPTTETTPLAATDLIHLRGPTRNTANVDTPWYVDRFILDSTAAFTLTGSTITFRPESGYGVGTSHDGRYFITNSTGALKTIDNDLVVLRAFKPVGAIAGWSNGSGISVGTGSLILNGDVDLQSVSGVRVSNGVGSVTFNGVISGSHGGWAINGGATTIFNNTNTYSGSMSVWSGVLKLGASGALGASTNSVAMSHPSAGTFKSTLVTTVPMVVPNSITIAPAFDDARATSNFTTLGSESAGLTEFTGAITNGSAAGIMRAITLSAAADGRVNFTQGIARNSSGTGVLDTLTKTGAGIVALGGTGTTNNWQGTTFVQQGTLLVNSTIATAAANVQVSSGATLGGTGTINRQVTIAAGGFLSAGDINLAGDSMGGTLALGGTLGLSLANTSVLEFDLATESSIIDDEIDVFGNFILDGILNVNALAGFGNGTYKLFDFTGLLTDNGLDVTTLGTRPAGFDYVIQITSPNNGSVNLVVTPEPGRALLLCFGLTTLLLRRRRR